MPTAADNPTRWFDAAKAAMATLQQRRRRAWPGYSSSAAASALPGSWPGGGGPGNNGGGGGGGGNTTTTPITSTAGTTAPPPILVEHVTAGGAGASASTAATVAAISSTNSMPAGGVSGLLGLGLIARDIRASMRRGIARHSLVFLVAGLVLVLAAIVRGQPMAQADGNKARVTIAPDGFALASFPDSLAIATGDDCGAIATNGRAFAAVPGSTATAYNGAKAAGVPGSVLILIGKRADGTTAAVALRPSLAATSTARPWRWFAWTNGTYADAGPVSEAEKLTVTNAQEGKLP